MGKVGQKIKAGVSTLWGAEADNKAYEAMLNNPDVPQVYKDRLLTQITGKGTELAIDAATTFTPVSRAIGLTQSFGKGRMDAAQRGGKVSQV